ncbi:conserved hypothetical protein [Uncinocarpus reesii 1704]|uniref:DUF1776-domain-containing protein n=1 Tax=Uncinocarpus reesii (strain UAMH 1704) TaxID=336963 RepID=C4JW26_UNCRE|nr:uncharacterized protein UREG_06768 [Uncinocarpus reesii 1704]EEP81903.1 conserved hypothetical protein [Uncinocarpus reesii 1704]
MTSDDEFFFDYVSFPETRAPASTSGDKPLTHSEVVLDSERYYIDRHIDHAASNVRDALSRQFWLPTYLRPPSRSSQRIPYSSPPETPTNCIYDWALDHRAWTAALLAFIGTGGLLIYGARKFKIKKRKARKASNGARKEIVVISGSAHDAITRSIACDLERRGFIVFITVTSSEEEHVVENEAREDIRSLWLDLANSLITNPQAPMPGVPPHTCQLTGLIVVPSLKYPTGPVATIPASSWADTINTRLLYPILTAQLFLPLLTIKHNTSSIVLVTPSIQSSLSSPFASPEVAVTRALSGFAASLRQELHLLENGHNAIDVIELKLGNLDFGRQFRNTSGQNKGTEVLTWQPHQRALYGSPYLSSIDYRLGRPAGTGSSHRTPAKELHFAVFDALAPRQRNIFGQRKRKQEVVYVGRGSRAYAMAGSIMPNVLIGWMLGLRTGYSAFSSDAGFDDGNGYWSEPAWEKVS